MKKVIGIAAVLIVVLGTVMASTALAQGPQAEARDCVRNLSGSGYGYGYGLFDEGGDGSNDRCVDGTFDTGAGLRNSSSGSASMSGAAIQRHLHTRLMDCDGTCDSDCLQLQQRLRAVDGRRVRQAQ